MYANEWKQHCVKISCCGPVLPHQCYWTDFCIRRHRLLSRVHRFIAQLRRARQLIWASVRHTLVTDRVSGKMRSVVSVRPSVCFNSIFSTNWPFTLNFCMNIWVMTIIIVGFYCHAISCARARRGVRRGAARPRTATVAESSTCGHGNTVMRSVRPRSLTEDNF